MEWGRLSLEWDLGWNPEGQEREKLPAPGTDDSNLDSLSEHGLAREEGVKSG
jgi:hypothetical protein